MTAPIIFDGDTPEPVQELHRILNPDAPPDIATRHAEARQAAEETLRAIAPGQLDALARRVLVIGGEYSGMIVRVKDETRPDRLAGKFTEARHAVYERVNREVATPAAQIFARLERLAQRPPTQYAPANAVDAQRLTGIVTTVSTWRADDVVGLLDAALAGDDRPLLQAVRPIVAAGLDRGTWAREASAPRMVGAVNVEEAIRERLQAIDILLLDEESFVAGEAREVLPRAREQLRQLIESVIERGGRLDAIELGVIHQMHSDLFATELAPEEISRFAAARPTL